MKHSLEELTLSSSMGRNKSSVVIKANDEEWRRPWRHFYWTQVVLSTLLIYSAASYKALLSGPEHSSQPLPGGGDSSSIGDRCDQWLISADGITGTEQRFMTQDISLWTSIYLVAAPPWLLQVRSLLHGFSDFVFHNIVYNNIIIIMQ